MTESISVTKRRRYRLFAALLGAALSVLAYELHRAGSDSARSGDRSIWIWDGRSMAPRRVP